MPQNPFACTGRGVQRGEAPLPGTGVSPVCGFIAPFLARGFASKPLFVHRTGCAEERSPFVGGTGVSPVFGFTTPFLARKGDRGMVERPVGHRRHRSGAEGQSSSEGPVAHESRSELDKDTFLALAAQMGLSGDAEHLDALYLEVRALLTRIAPLSDIDVSSVAPEEAMPGHGGPA